MADMMEVLALGGGQRRQRYAGQVVMALSSGRIADLIVNRFLRDRVVPDPPTHMHTNFKRF